MFFSVFFTVNCIVSVYVTSRRQRTCFLCGFSSFLFFYSSVLESRSILLGRFNRYVAVVTTTIRLRFDGSSTAYQRSPRSQWRSISADSCRPATAVTLTYLFTPQCSSPPAHRCTCDRYIGGRAIELLSNPSRIKVDSSRSCNHPLRRTFAFACQHGKICTWTANRQRSTVSWSFCCRDIKQWLQLRYDHSSRVVAWSRWSHCFNGGVTCFVSGEVICICFQPSGKICASFAQDNANQWVSCSGVGWGWNLAEVSSLSCVVGLADGCFPVYSFLVSIRVKWLSMIIYI